MGSPSLKFDVLALEEPIDRPTVFVRVHTGAWSDERGMYVKKSITYLKRRSSGFNFLEEDLYQVGAEDTLRMLTNIDEIEDGIYEVIWREQYRDWETNCVEEWDYRLQKVEE